MQQRQEAVRGHTHQACAHRSEVLQEGVPVAVREGKVAHDSHEPLPRRPSALDAAHYLAQQPRLARPQCYERVGHPQLLRVQQNALQLRLLLGLVVRLHLHGAAGIGDWLAVTRAAAATAAATAGRIRTGSSVSDDFRHVVDPQFLTRMQLLVVPVPVPRAEADFSRRRGRGGRRQVCGLLNCQVRVGAAQLLDDHQDHLQGHAGVVFSSAQQARQIVEQAHSVAPFPGMAGHDLEPGYFGCLPDNIVQPSQQLPEMHGVR